ADRKPLTGQVVLVPVQVSATSQGPAAARHVAPAFPAGCWQAAFVPSHWSSVQGLPSAVQAAPAGSIESAGHVQLPPPLFSAASYTSAAEPRTPPASPPGGAPMGRVP